MSLFSNEEENKRNFIGKMGNEKQERRRFFYCLESLLPDDWLTCSLIIEALCGLSLVVLDSIESV